MPPASCERTGGVRAKSSPAAHTFVPCAVPSMASNELQAEELEVLSSIFNEEELSTETTADGRLAVVVVVKEQGADSHAKSASLRVEFTTGALTVCVCFDAAQIVLQTIPTACPASECSPWTWMATRWTALRQHWTLRPRSCWACPWCFLW